MRYYKIVADIQYHYRRKSGNSTKEVDEMLQIFDYVQAPGKRYLSKKRVEEILLHDAQFNVPHEFEFLDFELLKLISIDQLPKDTTATPRLNVFYINGLYDKTPEKKYNTYGAYELIEHNEFITDKERIWKRL
ncbi:MAG: hypothetical protein J6A79_00685 [Clostridia bacterium]|nr:hypothetical protein [Clostridia bacterium]